MERRQPIVVRPEDASLPAGPPTPGMDRRQLLDQEDCWAGWVRMEAGLTGGWHHHGERDSYIYVLRGRVTIEHGPGGRDRLTGTAGDFIFNPGGMVHREIAGADEPAEVFVLRVGEGPQNVNVDGPNSDADGT
jgi:uncharacterized RmlC-like cupin family protein